MIFCPKGLLLVALLSPDMAKARISAPANRVSLDEAPAADPDPNTPNATKTLSLEEALRLAAEYNPILKAAISRTEGAEAGITTATAYPNPDFNTLLGKQMARPIATPGVPGMLQHYSVSQPLELRSVRRTRASAARLNRESTNWELASVRRSVRTAVKHAFYDVLRRKEEIAHAQENLRLVEDLRRRTQVQVDVGEAARLELARAEAEIAKAQSIVKSARIEYVAAISALRAAVSAPLPAGLDPQGLLTPPVTLPSLDKIRALVLSHYPLLAQARTDVKRAQAVLANEKALRAPQPTIAAEFEEQPDLRFYRVGVSIPLPIWDRRKGPIGEAAAAVQEANAIAQQRSIEITAALERAYGLYEVANQQVISFEGGALRQAETAVRAAEAAYKFGERGIIEVLDAQRVLQTIRGDFLDAQFERQSALIDLEELGALDREGKKP